MTFLPKNLHNARMSVEIGLQTHSNCMKIRTLDVVERFDCTCMSELSLTPVCGEISYIFTAPQLFAIEIFLSKLI